jgi:TMEM175 potassium channel family protein
MSDIAGEDIPRRWTTSRVEAFSDGVFAIAITLLVLDIKVDASDFDHLARALLHQWPAYLSYVTSFLTVGSVWIAHHNLFTRLKYVDAALLRLNMLLLMAAAFLPFPTGVLAEALNASNSAERAAIAFYGATVLVIELLLVAGVRHVGSQPDLLVEPSEAEALPTRRRHERRGWFRTLAYPAAIAFGIVAFPKVAAVGYLVVAAEGVLLLGGRPRFSLRKLLSRA